MLNYGFQTIEIQDIKAVIKALKSKWLTTGPYVHNFERLFAQKVGVRYAVAVCNATAALHLAVAAVELPKKSEGITSSITFLATSNAMLYNDIKPIFADINPKTYNIEPNEIFKKINKKTSLLIPVHFAGQPADMEKINKHINRKKITVIEDAAHAIGSRYKNGKMVGSCLYSDMTVFSFHPVKTITTGEGGMITTNNKKYYERLLMLRNHGLTKDTAKLSQNPGPWYYEMQILGYNFRMTDMQAALGISQLKRLDKFVAKRRMIIKKYNNAFKDIAWLTIPFEDKDLNSAFHLYVLLIDFIKINKTRKQVMEELAKKGIGTQVHYIPIYMQPYYRQHYKFNKFDYPAAEKYYKSCLSIPLYPTLKDKEINKIIKAIGNLNK